MRAYLLYVHECVARTVIRELYTRACERVEPGLWKARETRTLAITLASHR